MRYLGCKSTTGIAANLLGRNFGIDQETKFLELGIQRKDGIEDIGVATKMLRRMAENPEEVQVIVNHARPALQKKMIAKGLCYMRVGDSRGLFSLPWVLSEFSISCFIQMGLLQNFID